MATTDKEKQYVYIVQSSLERTKCKIGKTNDLDRRLKEYNGMTGKSKENIYQYLYACEVKNMTQVENAIKEHFLRYRENKSREMYFCNLGIQLSPVKMGAFRRFFRRSFGRMLPGLLCTACWSRR